AIRRSWRLTILVRRCSSVTRRRLPGAKSPASGASRPFEGAENPKRAAPDRRPATGVVGRRYIPNMADGQKAAKGGDGKSGVSWKTIVLIVLAIYAFVL